MTFDRRTTVRPGSRETSPSLPHVSSGHLDLAVSSEHGEVREPVPGGEPLRMTRSV